MKIDSAAKVSFPKFMNYESHINIKWRYGKDFLNALVNEGAKGTQISSNELLHSILAKSLRSDQKKFWFNDLHSLSKFIYVVSVIHELTLIPGVEK